MKAKIKIFRAVAGDAMPEFDQPAFKYEVGSVQRVALGLAEKWMTSGHAGIIVETNGVLEPSPYKSASASL